MCMASKPGAQNVICVGKRLVVGVEFRSTATVSGMTPARLMYITCWTWCSEKLQGLLRIAKKLRKPLLRVTSLRCDYFEGKTQSVIEKLVLDTIGKNWNVFLIK